MKAIQVRMARPTNKMEALVHFYTEGLGLQVIGSFKDHAGYDGVMLGHPSLSWHLEFTHHKKGSSCPAPSRDNLLVLYFETTESYQEAVSKMKQAGAIETEPENSYWAGKSTSFEDPDGWGVVLFNGLYKISNQNS
jgi:uncharacterized glyoxalase superfamily protein PhnB